MRETSQNKNIVKVDPSHKLEPLLNDNFPSNERTLMIDFCVNNLGCGCNTIGIELCSGWQNCSCKTEYSGAACSECVEGYFMNGKQCTTKNTFP